TLGPTPGGRDLPAFRIGPTTGPVSVLMAGSHPLHSGGGAGLGRLVPVPLGPTRGGRDLPAFRIGPTTGPVSVLMAGIHALEWIGVEVLESLVAELLEHGVDREVVVVPILNLHGLAP